MLLNTNIPTNNVVKTYTNYSGTKYRIFSLFFVSVLDYDCPTILKSPYETQHFLPKTMSRFFIRKQFQFELILTSRYCMIDDITMYSLSQAELYFPV